MTRLIKARTSQICSFPDLEKAKRLSNQTMWLLQGGVGGDVSMIKGYFSLVRFGLLQGVVPPVNGRFTTPGELKL